MAYAQEHVENLAESFINGNLSVVRKEVLHKPALVAAIALFLTEYYGKSKGNRFLEYIAGNPSLVDKGEGYLS